MFKAYRAFVALTGFCNLLGGPALLLLSDNLRELGSKPFLFVTAGFLSFSGIALIWAAQDIPQRALLVFWEGVLRIFAAAAFLAMPSWAHSQLVVAGDGSIGLVYVIGLFVAARVTLAGALFGRPARAAVA